jgi:periplasmic protein TonB
MRAWTLGVSIVVHLCFIASVVVAPLFATDDLPVPPRATEYVLVTATFPDPPAIRRPDARTPSASTAPITSPDSVAPEPEVAPTEPGPAEIDAMIGEPGGTGVVPGSVVAGDPLPLPPVPLAPKEPVRVGGAIRPPQKIREVAPRYPAMAQAAHVQGTVILEAVIGENGDVQNVRVLRSVLMLDDAAIDAVRQWRFTPTLLNGQPVPVVMTVTVSFTMNR